MRDYNNANPNLPNNNPAPPIPMSELKAANLIRVVTDVGQVFQLTPASRKTGKARGTRTVRVAGFHQAYVVNDKVGEMNSDDDGHPVIYQIIEAELAPRGPLTLVSSDITSGVTKGHVDEYVIRTVDIVN